MNKFNQGQMVICISESFPQKITTKADKSELGIQADLHPKKNEILPIHDILGEYLNFEKYDTDKDIRWWHYTRFAPIDELELTQEDLEFAQILQTS